MSTAAVESRLTDLTAEHRALVEQQGVVERELMQLRTDDVLGRLEHVVLTVSSHLGNIDIAYVAGCRVVFLIQKPA
jgi:hypothetical protein